MMSRKRLYVFAALAALVAALVMFASIRRARGGGGRGVGETKMYADPVPSLEPSEPQAKRQEVAPTPPDGAGNATIQESTGVRVKIVWADSTPAAGIRIKIESWHRSVEGQKVWLLQSDNQGEAFVPHIPIGRATAALDRGITKTIELRPGRVTEVVIQIPDAQDLFGVVRRGQSPVVGATIRIGDFSSRFLQYEVAVTDSQGAFVIRDLQPQVGCGIQAIHELGRSAVVRLWPNESSVSLLLRESCGALFGTVRDSQGERLSGVSVNLQPPIEQPYIDGEGRVVTVSAIAECRTNALGQYRLVGLEGGNYRLAVANHAFRLTEDIVLPSGVTSEQNITLGGPGILAGMVVTATQGLAPGAQVSLTVAGFGASASTDSDGRFRIEGTPLGAAEIRARHEALGVAHTSINLSTGLQECTLLLETGSQLSGVLQSSTGSPLRDWWVGATEEPCPRPNGSFDKLAVTDQLGSFFIFDCNPLASYVIEAIHPSDARILVVDSYTGIRPAVGLVLTVPQGKIPTGGVEGSVVNESERPFSEGYVLLRMTGESDWANYCLDPGGAFHIGPIVSGNYDLEIHARGHADLRVGGLAVGDGVVSLGMLHLTAGGRLEVSFSERRDMEVAIDAECVVTSQADVGTRWSRFVDGKAVFNSLSPGVYEIRCSGPYFAPETRAIRVVSGEMSRLVLRDLSATVARQLAISVPADSIGQTWDVLVTGTRPTPVFSETVLVRQEDVAAGAVFRRLLGLDVGEYLVRVTQEARTISLSFSIDDLERREGTIWVGER